MMTHVNPRIDDLKHEIIAESELRLLTLKEF